MKLKILFIILSLTLMASCTKEVIVKEEVIVYVNNTITEYVDVIEIQYINTTIDNTKECVQKYSQKYVNTFIRDYERCKYEMKFLNRSVIVDEYYDMNISLSRCEDKLDKIEEALN